MASIIDEVARETATAVGVIDPREPTVSSSPPPGTSLPMVDTQEMRAALEATPPHLLLGVYGHLTADMAFLERVRPHVRSILEGGPQVPENLAKELRERLLARLIGPQSANPSPLSKGDLATIMGIMVGAPISDEFIPMLIDQMGFTPIGRFAPGAHVKPPRDYRVAVIGAGLTGIAMAIKLRAAGYDYRIFEKAEEVGGVWWSNRYPGVAVDTPSHFYSYSFEINPDWPRRLSDGDVLMQYWRHVADKYGIRERISFQTEVLSSKWLEDAKRWRLSLRKVDGAEWRDDFDVIVCASGLFSHPQEPKVPGLKRFKGRAVHTASWDPTIDFNGKRVVQIGTGASGVQVGPVIATVASKLTVFQRTPPYVIVQPEQGKEFGQAFRWALRRIPHLGQWMRFYTYWNAADWFHQVVRLSPEFKNKDRAANPLGEQFGKAITDGMRARLSSRPDIIERVIPNYPFMGKRPLQDSDWLDMLLRDNVELVSQAVAEIVEDGVVAKDGAFYPADTLILATGFAMTNMLKHIEFVGRGGIHLADIWGEEDPRAYYGTLVPDFPNLFIMHGPNFGATHGAGVNIYSEAQVNYVLACLDLMFRRGAATIEVRPEAFREFNERVDAACSEMVWAHPRANTYYLNSKRRNFISWPWRIVDVWESMRTPKISDLKV
jgi:4-hydroxyacetophenone monooxygenase